MLHPQVRQALVEMVKEFLAKVGGPGDDSPSEMYDDVLEVANEMNLKGHMLAFKQNLIDNRKEAEQVIAGCLGMM